MTTGSCSPRHMLLLHTLASINQYMNTLASINLYMNTLAGTNLHMNTLAGINLYMPNRCGKFQSNLEKFMIALF